MQASYIKKRELCRLKQKEQRDALKTLTKLPTVEPPVEIPIEQIPSENLQVEIPIEQIHPVKIPPDLMEDKTRVSFEKQVKPMPVRSFPKEKQVRPDKLSIEPRQKKSSVLDLFR